MGMALRRGSGHVESLPGLAAGREGAGAVEAVGPRLAEARRARKAAEAPQPADQPPP